MLYLDKPILRSLVSPSPRPLTEPYCDPTSIELEPFVQLASSITPFREVQDDGTSWSRGSGGSEMPPVTTPGPHPNLYRLPLHHSPESRGRHHLELESFWSSRFSP